jgi:hypothetical protein
MICRLIPLVASLVILAHHALPAEEAPPQTLIGDLLVVPLSDLVPGNEHIDMHVKALAGVRADSRLLTGDDDSGDVALRGIAGFDLRYSPDETTFTLVSATIEGRRYIKHRDLDGLGGAASIDYRNRGLFSAVVAGASWILTDELLLDTGERLVGDTYRAGAALKNRQRLSHYDLAIEATRKDYREGGRLFGADDSDHYRLAADLHLAWDYASEAYLFSHTRLEDLLYDRHVLYDDSVGFSQSIGWSRHIAERSSFSAEAGLVLRHFLGRGAADPDNRLAPFGLISVIWPWEEDSRLRGRIFSDLQDTATRAATWVYGTAWDVRYHLAVATHLLVEGGIQQLRDSETPPGGTREVRTVSDAKIGIEHQLRVGWAFRIFGSYLESRAEVGSSYRNFSAVGEVGFVY